MRLEFVGTATVIVFLGNPADDAVHHVTFERATTATVDQAGVPYQLFFLAAEIFDRIRYGRFDVGQDNFTGHGPEPSQCDRLQDRTAAHRHERMRRRIWRR